MMRKLNTIAYFIFLALAFIFVIAKDIPKANHMLLWAIVNLIGAKNE